MNAEESAKDQILHTCFQRFHIGTLEARQHVERHRDQLQRDEQQAEIIRRRCEHHARQSEQDERVILRDATFDAVRILHGKDQHDDRCKKEKPFEIEGKPVLHIHAAKRVTRPLRPIDKAIQQNAADDERRPIAKLAFHFRRCPQVHQQQQQPGCDHCDFQRYE